MTGGLVAQVAQLGGRRLGGRGAGCVRACAGRQRGGQVGTGGWCTAGGGRRELGQALRPPPGAPPLSIARRSSSSSAGPRAAAPRTARSTPHLDARHSRHHLQPGRHGRASGGAAVLEPLPGASVRRAARHRGAAVARRQEGAAAGAAPRPRARQRRGRKRAYQLHRRGRQAGAAPLLPQPRPPDHFPRLAQRRKLRRVCRRHPPAPHQPHVPGSLGVLRARRAGGVRPGRQRTAAAGASSAR